MGGILYIRYIVYTEDCFACQDDGAQSPTDFSELDRDVGTGIARPRMANGHPYKSYPEQSAFAPLHLFPHTKKHPDHSRGAV